MPTTVHPRGPVASRRRAEGVIRQPSHTDRTYVPRGDVSLG
ncbi:hypothetical protein [Streptomyces halstedii]